MTNNVPTVCVDIFSQMANLLSNFNANSALSSGGSETFTHGDGFVSQSTDYINNQSTGGAANFEDQMNDYCFYLFAGMMVMFLAYQYLSNSLLEQRMNVK